MKSKRAKANRKTMHLYTSVFKFRQPYQVLIDADFAITAVAQKMDVQPRLEALLGGLAKPMMTQCTISHLYSLPSTSNSNPSAPSPSQLAIDLSRAAFTRRLCNHGATKPSTSSCLLGIIGPENRHRYCVATQDATLRKRLREEVPGTPVVYVNKGGVLVLEDEGPVTETKRRRLEEGKRHVGTEERELLEGAGVRGSTLPKAMAAAAAAEEEGEEEAGKGEEGLTSGAKHDPSTAGGGRLKMTEGRQVNDAATRWQNKLKKGKAKGPNPLSVQRKKKTNAKDDVKGTGGKKARSSISEKARKGAADGGAGEDGKKRKRRRRAGDAAAAPS